MGWLGGEAGFGLVLVNGHDGREAAALLRVLPVPFVGQKAFQGDQQEGAEFALLARGGLQVILLQQPRKKALSEFLGVGRAAAGAAGVGVEGIPIGAAERFEGLGRFRGAFGLRGKHHGPMGGDENRARGRGLRGRRRREVVGFEPGGAHSRERNRGG